MKYYTVDGQYQWRPIFLVPCALTVLCAVAFLLVFREPMEQPEPKPAQEGEEGENPAPRVDGFEGAAIGGIEFAVSPKFAFQVAGLYSYMKTDEVDLTAINLGFVDKGTSWSLRVSARWKP